MLWSSSCFIHWHCYHIQGHCHSNTPIYLIGWVDSTTISTSTSSSYFLHFVICFQFINHSRGRGLNLHIFLKHFLHYFFSSFGLKVRYISNLVPTNFLYTVLNQWHRFRSRRGNFPLYLLDLFTDNDGVGFSELFTSVSFVIESTIVFIRVTMKSTVQASASTFETYRKQKVRLRLL